MSFKTTLITMILAALSIAAMVISMGKGSPDGAFGEGGEASASLMALRELPVDDITRITLQRGDEPPMVFLRQGTRWMQTEPFEFPMGLFSIRQLAVLAKQLGQPGGALPLDSSEANTDEAMGFDPPRATIRYQGEGQDLTIELGRLVGAGRGYLRLAGEDRIYSVNQNLHQRAIQDNVWVWREKKIFHDVNVDAEVIERVAGDDRLKLERKDGRWSIIEPVQTGVQAEALELWLRGLDGAQIADFRSDQPVDLAPFGLDDPVASLSLTVTRRTTIDGESYPERKDQRLLIGARLDQSTNDRFAMLEPYPVVFRLTGETQARLFPFTQNVVRQTATAVSVSDIKSLTIQGPDTDLRFERDLEQWRAPDHDNAIVEARLVNELIKHLTQTQPERVIIDAYPKDRQVGMVHLIGYNNRPLTTVRIARGDQGEWLLENGDNVLRIYPASLGLRLELTDYGLTPVEPSPAPSTP